MSERRVVISGGGTGGHLYPALAVGRKLREADPSLQLTFVGSRRAVEKSIMDEQGVDFVPLRIEGLKGRGLRSLRGLAFLPFAFLKSFGLLVRLRPRLVVGVGGYSSGPVVLLASWLGVPTVILEQNVRPGYTNRLLIRRVKKAVAAFEATLPSFLGKGVWLGNPVREEFYGMPAKAAGPALSILVSGGSQGSRFLNRTMTAALPFLRKKNDRLEIVHQTGKNNITWVEKAYGDSDFAGATVAPYFPDMAARFRRADLVVSRAGATTCAELIASGRPSLLVPFAAASENHQELNARELEQAGGAEVILQKDLTPEVLAARVFHYLERRDSLFRMAVGLAPLRTDGAAEGIAKLCFRLMAGEK
jgi:UDP-N-acetylglucosamine--N-acetylmuramyl-(pentapeptide) pyrophosphoryl-undecaprenol N-acetylglucosamine transferase